VVCAVHSSGIISDILEMFGFLQQMYISLIINRKFNCCKLS